MKAVELSKSIEGLTSALQGRVCLPGQKNYDELRTPWLRVINQHPALIVEATSVSDIAAAVRFACNHSLPLGVMSTGHGIAAACDDGLLLRLTQMKRIEINSETNSARKRTSSKRTSASVLQMGVPISICDHCASGCTSLPRAFWAFGRTCSTRELSSRVVGLII